MSEGAFQSESAFLLGAGTLSLVAGGRYHPFTMRTALWTRLNATNVDIYLELLDGDKVYLIDSVLATGAKSYVFPNVRVPYPVTVVPAQRVRLRVVGAVAGENQAGLITWAELGVP